MASSRQMAISPVVDSSDIRRSQRLGSAIASDTDFNEIVRNFTAEHFNWPSMATLSIDDPNHFVLIVHWGGPRRFTLQAQGNLVGCFDAQPGDWTLLRPGTADCISVNGSCGPVLLISFALRGNKAVEPGPSADINQTAINIARNFDKPLPQETLRLNGGHCSLIEDMCLQVVRHMHRGDALDAIPLCLEIIRNIMAHRGPGVLPVHNPDGHHMIDLGGTFTPSAQATNNLRGGLAPFNLRRVTDYIEANLTDTLSVDQLAALASLSPFHFARSFKQSTGLTPHQYVTECRMRQAKSLLSQMDRKLAEVGQRAGFSSQSRFTTVFRKNVGATPGEYRRLIQAKLIA